MSRKPKPWFGFLKAANTRPLSYAGAAIDQVEMFKYLGTTMHATRGLTAALETRY